MGEIEVTIWVMGPTGATDLLLGPPDSFASKYPRLEYHARGLGLGLFAMNMHQIQALDQKNITCRNSFHLPHSTPESDLHAWH